MSVIDISSQTLHHPSTSVLLLALLASLFLLLILRLALPRIFPSFHNLYKFAQRRNGHVNPAAGDVATAHSESDSPSSWKQKDTSNQAVSDNIRITLQNYIKWEPLSLPKWDGLPVSLDLYMNKQSPPVRPGFGVGVSAGGNITPSLVEDVLKLAPPPVEMKNYNPRLLHHPTRPSIYDSQPPLSAAKIIMSRHTLRRPNTSRAPRVRIRTSSPSPSPRSPSNPPQTSLTNKMTFKRPSRPSPMASSSQAGVSSPESSTPSSPRRQYMV